jgi:hypothetical protein
LAFLQLCLFIGVVVDINKRKAKITSNRTQLDCANMSIDAQNRLLYTKRVPQSKREKIILKIIQFPLGNQLYFLYYLLGFCAFIPWCASGWQGLILSFAGAGFVLYRYIKLNILIEERLIYERESPVKSIGDIHNEHANDGLRLSCYSVGLTVLLFVITNAV